MVESQELKIIREVLLGDPQPFELLVREYQNQIYSLVLRSVKESELAADLVQETFIKAYAKLESFNLKKRFFPWLYTIALNVIRDHIRASGWDVHVFMDDPEFFAAGNDGTMTAEQQIDGQTLFLFIEKMAPKYREALILRYKYEFSTSEIAEVLEISDSGVKMRLKRGLEMVRDQFKEVAHDEF